MKPVFHPDAALEFKDAVRRYAEMDSALGSDFEAKVEESLVNAVVFPDAWRELVPGIRRCLLRRFPYGIIYTHDEDNFYVLAIMHLHQKPDYWKKRI